MAPTRASTLVAAPARSFPWLGPATRQALMWSALLLGAVTIGIVGAKLNVMLIAGLAIAIIGASLVLAFPSLALVGLWVMSFGMLPAVLVPGAVQDQTRNLIELSLLGMAGLLAARAFFDERIDISDLILPWAAFLAAWLLLWIAAFVRGYFIERYTFAIPDARKHFGWAMLIVAAFVERHRPWRLHSIVVAVASILSFELLVQAASGRLILAQIYEFKAEGSEGSSIPRGTTWGAEYLMMYVVYYCLQRLTAGQEPQRWRKVLPLLLLNMAGLLCTFTRGIWVAAIAGLVFLVLFGGPLRIRLAVRLGIAAVVAVVALVGLSAAGSKLADAVVGRALSYKDEGGRGTSVGARLDENQQAIKPMRENFWTGLGHGGEYKTYLNPEEFPEQAIYIHNGYFYIQLKYGFLGTLSLVLLIGLVVWVSGFVRRRIPPEDPWFWRSQAGMGCMFAFAVNAVSSPVWLELGPTMGLACALTHMAAARAQAAAHLPRES